MSDKTLGKARGLNSIANPRDFKGSPGRRKRTDAEIETETERATPSAPSARDDAGTERPTRRREPATPAPEVAEVEQRPAAAEAPLPAPHRAVQPGVQRKRRELSIPHTVAEALEATGINAADVVMSGYRNHGDAIYAGAGGRMAARGRTRLRLSISDAEFEQITRLGLARGWNRSETVSVILAMELEAQPAAHS